MTEYLIKQAFEKAGKESDKDSLNGRAEFLSEYLLEEFKYSISAKSLTRYFKKESYPNQQLKNYLAQYLGCENYDDFVLKNSDATAANKGSIPATNHRSLAKKFLITTILVIIIILISVFVGFVSGKENCMLWDGNRYVETTCAGDKHEQKLNPYLLESFKKTEVTDTTTFFKNGEVQVWYDKSNNQLEFFTAPGIHPENGKTLKPVSEYIVEKYVK